MVCKSPHINAIAPSENFSLPFWTITAKSVLYLCRDSIEIAGHQSVGKPFFLVCLAVVIRNELVTKLSFQRAFYWLFVALLSSVNVR